MHQKLKIAGAGLAAGAVNGLFGAGGGMVLVPILEKTGEIPETQLFSGSLAVMLPICLTSLMFTQGALPLRQALPYLVGSFLGGLLCQRLRQKVKPLWLHRALGAVIFLGGVRMLWD